MEQIDAYPLTWPVGWPRTPAQKRSYGRFSKVTRQYQQYGDGETRGYDRRGDVTIAQAMQRIQSEVRAFGRRKIAESLIVSTNLRVRTSDGQPASGQKEPDDPGAAVYFEFDGKMQCVPCDAYTKVAQNLAGVAASLSALRALERHGSGIMERAFRGFEALPNLAEQPWWIVLNLPEDAPWEVVELQYRKLRSAYHPDHNGDAVQFDRIVKAFAAAEGART